MPSRDPLQRRDFLKGAAAAAALCVSPAVLGAYPKRRNGGVPRALDPAKAQTYLASFREQERAATGTQGPDIWPWMEANLPWFECPDPLIERLYYFRWYSFQKHIGDTGRGRLITEFLKPVPWGGYGQTIPDAVPHHLREARWLRQDTAAVDYARFWTTEDAKPRNYSLALAHSIRQVALARGDMKLVGDLRDALAANYAAWEASQQDANGLFWSIDTRDGMEVSVSGDGYRPTLNSYMFGDAATLAAAFRLAGDAAGAKHWSAKADEQRARVERELWNPMLGFYATKSPAKDSGIRAQKKFKDNGTALALCDARELAGYVPWCYDLPTDTARAAGWKQLFDPQGFAAKYGPLTVERRHPRFRFPTNDKCPWNGPAWNFATTQTVVALGNLLNGPAQPYATKADYLGLMQVFAFGQRLTLPSGEVITWTDEAQDADTGRWITREHLALHNQAQYGRGNYYNHSGFCDPVITGLVGLRPREDDTVEVNPLLPAGAWRYFAIDALPYHGRLLRVQWDADGARYGAGSGLRVWADGKLLGSSTKLERMTVKLG